MIKSYKDTATRQFVEQGKSRYRGMDVDSAVKRLMHLDAAGRPEDLGNLRSLNLHKLKGDLKEYWALTINGPWRLLFKFRDGHAHDVWIHDYH